jgi:hypothetical protein
MSLISFLKVGGDVNNIAPATYFLAFSVALVFVDFFSHSLDSFAPIFKKRTKVFLVIIFLLLIRSGLNNISYQFNQVKIFSENIHDVACRYAKKNPNKVYFPELSLSNLLADKRLYHSLDGVSDRLLAKFLFEPSKIYAYAPKSVEMIAFVSNFESIEKNENDFVDLLEWRKLFNMHSQSGKTKEALICLEEMIRLEPLKEENWKTRKHFYEVLGGQSFYEESSLEFPSRRVFFDSTNRRGSDIYFYLMKFFSEFKRVNVGELPGFIVFKKKNMTKEKSR